mmetsp:Transcript_17434/g.44633  ORF Transcript_17434/g.44633 Transcript_17434/m.44633 type:complete len:212 (-) Transcript_17434:491-1126(-)
MIRPPALLHPHPEVRPQTSVPLPCSSAAAIGRLTTSTPRFRSNLALPLSTSTDVGSATVSGAYVCVASSAISRSTSHSDIERLSCFIDVTSGRETLRVSTSPLEAPDMASAIERKRLCSGTARAGAKALAPAGCFAAGASGGGGEGNSDSEVVDGRPAPPAPSAPWSSCVTTAVEVASGGTATLASASSLLCARGAAPRAICSVRRNASSL